MAKDFDGWNRLKKNLEDTSQNKLYFYSREIWWCAVGTNLGTEMDGKNENFERPVLIIRKFNKDMFWGLALTSKTHTSPFHQEIKTEHGSYWIVTSQLRVLSTKRLLRKIARLSDVDFDTISRAVRNLLP